MYDSALPPQEDLYNAVHDVPKPVSIKVFGILQIVFGSMGCVCGGLGAGFVLLIMSNPEVSNVINHGMGMDYTEGYQTLQIGIGTATLLLSAFQIVCGVGLLKNRFWGRTGSLLYATLGILVSIISTTITVSMMKETPDKMINMTFTLGSGAFVLIYPGCILFFLTRPKVVEALRDR